MYSTLSELEDNVVVSKAASAAEALWRNKELSLKERIKALEKYGKKVASYTLEDFYNTLGKEMGYLFTILEETRGEMEEDVPYKIYYDYENVFETIDVVKIFFEILNYRRVKSGNSENLIKYRYLTDDETFLNQLDDEEKDLLEKIFLGGYGKYYFDY